MRETEYPIDQRWVAAQGRAADLNRQLVGNPWFKPGDRVPNVSGYRRIMARMGGGR